MKLINSLKLHKIYYNVRSDILDTIPLQVILRVGRMLVQISLNIWPGLASRFNPAMTSFASFGARNDKNGAQTDLETDEWLCPFSIFQKLVVRQLNLWFKQKYTKTSTKNIIIIECQLHCCRTFLSSRQRKSTFSKNRKCYNPAVWRSK